MNEEFNRLLEEQLKIWDLAHTNYQALNNVRTKSFNFGDFEVKVQFNPGRIKSSGAKVDEKSIAERKCFLCNENLPKEQLKIEMVNYNILVNPYPIFPKHFTVVHHNHTPQKINNHIHTLLSLAQNADEFLFFYNGPRCGASAPDHLHFQGGSKSFLPLISDFEKLKTKAKCETNNATRTYIIQPQDYLRTVICIESDDNHALVKEAEKIIKSLSDFVEEEPMMNIITTYTDKVWNLFILPRKSFRPWQYNATDDNQLLVSPATVEMGGIFITPIETHFNKITKEDVISIFNQTTKNIYDNK